MSSSTLRQITELANIDFFGTCRAEECYVGRPFYFDYTKVYIQVNDFDKKTVGGIPASCFLLAIYNSDATAEEAILLRVIGPTKLPADQDNIAAMLEYYKESAPAVNVSSKLDIVTKNEFQHSGLECRILGTFYKADDGLNNGKIMFGSDIESFYSANNYSVFKPSDKILEYIVNFKADGGVIGGEGDVRIGEVRYSSTIRKPTINPVPVFVTATDFLAKRTALFGMTRTGKSNTVKKIIQCIEEVSASKSTYENEPLAPVGQIIFDVNGEYANANRQDEGTAIFEMYDDKVTRYSNNDKLGFKVMKVNFYRDIEQGVSLLGGLLKEDTSDYVKGFRSIDFSLDTEKATDRSYMNRRGRKIAVYQCCLSLAGFQDDHNTPTQVRFQGNADLNGLSGATIDPSQGISLDQATTWFGAVWRNYQSLPFFANYRRDNGHDWADDDLQILLRILTRRSASNATITGYGKFKPAKQFHTSSVQSLFEDEIVDLLRNGQIVIIDLSEGDPNVQRTFSERICQRIFNDAMHRFVSNESANCIQMYFEEAHNLFPKKEDSDLTQIYNRLAKEGAKLRIGINYATQEVSSVSSNILKATQNWFISHLNNRDELREIEKFYDFGDFTDSLQQATDKGFIRMKTYSNAFIVPVQIDRFSARASTLSGK